MRCRICGNYLLKCRNCGIYHCISCNSKVGSGLCSLCTQRILNSSPYIETAGLHPVPGSKKFGKRGFYKFKPGDEVSLKRKDICEDDFYVYSSVDMRPLGCNLFEAFQNQDMKAVRIVQIHYHFPGDVLAGVNAVVNGFDRLFKNYYGDCSSIILCGTLPNIPRDNIFVIPALSSHYDFLVADVGNTKIKPEFKKGIFNKRALETASGRLCKTLFDYNSNINFIFQNPLVGLNMIITNAIYKAGFKKNKNNIIVHNHDPREGRFDFGSINLAEHLPRSWEKNWLISNSNARSNGLKDWFKGEEGKRFHIPLETQGDYLHKALYPNGKLLKSTVCKIPPLRFASIHSAVYPWEHIILPPFIKDVVSNISLLKTSSCKTSDFFLYDTVKPKSYDYSKLPVIFLALSPMVDHKNILGAIELADGIAKIYEQKHLANKIKLIITGMRDVPSLGHEEVGYAKKVMDCLYEKENNYNRFASRTMQLKDTYQIRKNLTVHVLGGIKEEYKPAVCALADALFYLSVPQTTIAGGTSDSEGMGMPPVEMAYFNYVYGNKDGICVVAKGLPKPSQIGSVLASVESDIYEDHGGGKMINIEEDSLKVFDILMNGNKRRELAQIRYKLVKKDHFLNINYFNRNLKPYLI